MLVDARRVRAVDRGTRGSGPVVCWMSRDQRVDDNWALLFAREMALERAVPLVVVFCLFTPFLGAGLRQYGFLLRGLAEVERSLRERGIPFALLRGDPRNRIPAFVEAHRCGAVVTDFSPLRIRTAQVADVAAALEVPLYEVDAHNVVPARYVTDKREYAARTIRPKLWRTAPAFLTDFPELEEMDGPIDRWPPVDWDQVWAGLDVRGDIPEATSIVPGEAAALRCLEGFLAERLARYPEERNDPARDALSGLSPYLHFGQIAPQRAALAVQAADAPQEAKDAFLEESIVRRELAENFCLHAEDYDHMSAFPDWARTTLAEHAEDPRPALYSLEEMERAATHDEAWNAAQKEMVRTGKMHGYMRMYWGKKILEWSESPQEAYQIAIFLNNTYELDGRNPNGYAGVAWCFGNHDQGWKERPVYGKVRYMNANGLKRKFDAEGYVEKVKRMARR